MLISGRGDVARTRSSDLTGEGDELGFTGVIFKPSATIMLTHNKMLSKHGYDALGRFWRTEAEIREGLDQQEKWLRKAIITFRSV